MEVSPGRFRKGFIWTIRCSMVGFAPGDFVKVLFGRSGGMWRLAPVDFVKVSPGRSCELWGVAPDDFVKVLFGRSGVAC